MRKIVILILSVLLLASTGVAVAAGAQSFASAAENDAAEAVTEVAIIKVGNTEYSEVPPAGSGQWYVRQTVAFDCPSLGNVLAGIESLKYNGSSNGILYDYLILNGQKGQIINQHMNIYRYGGWGGYDLVDGKLELTFDMYASQLAMDGTDTFVLKEGMPLVWDTATGEVSCVLDKDYTFRFVLYDEKFEPNLGKWYTEDIPAPEIYKVITGSNRELIVNFDMDRRGNIDNNTYDKISSAQQNSDTFRNMILLNSEPIPADLHVHYNIFDYIGQNKVELYIWTSTDSAYAPTDGTQITLKKGLYVMNGNVLREDIVFEYNATYQRWGQVGVKLRDEESYASYNEPAYEILSVVFDAHAVEVLNNLSHAYEEVRSGVLINGEQLTDADFIHMNFTGQPLPEKNNNTQLSIYLSIDGENGARFKRDGTDTLTFAEGTEFPFGKLGYDLQFQFVPNEDPLQDAWGLEYIVSEVITDGYGDDFVFEYGQKDAEIAIDKLNVVYTNGFMGELPVTWSSSAVDTSRVGSGSATGTLTGAEFASGVSDEVTIPYTVNKKTLTVTPDAQTITYGDDIAQTAYTITGFIDGESTDNVIITGTPVLTASSDQVSAQNKTIALSVDGMSADNYVFVAGQSAALTINKRAITIKADDVTIKAGEELPLFTYQITSGTLAEGDELSSISIYTDTDATSDSPAGTYTISLTGVSDNYDITFETGVLTIEGSGGNGGGSGGGDDGETGGCASALVPGVSVIGAAVLLCGAVLVLRKKRSTKN